MNPADSILLAKPPGALGLGAPGTLAAKRSISVF